LRKADIVYDISDPNYPKVMADKKWSDSQVQAHKRQLQDEWYAGDKLGGDEGFGAAAWGTGAAHQCYCVTKKARRKAIRKRCTTRSKLSKDAYKKFWLRNCADTDGDGEPDWTKLSEIPNRDKDRLTKSLECSKRLTVKDCVFKHKQC
jgi:hypothetical protein